MTRRRTFLRAASAGLAGVALGARGQSRGKLPVVGFLSPAGADSLTQFLAAMRDLGHAEGRDFALERRLTAGRADVLPEMAAELVRLNVAVLYATGPAALRAAKGATGVIPIVALDLETDPVADGMVQSLGRPGGNITGLFLDQPAIAGKWLELLGQAAPQRRRVAVLWDATTGRAQIAAAEGAARRLGVELQVLEFGSGEALDRALRGAIGGKAQAMLQLSSPLVSVNSRPIAEFAAQHRLPAISPFRAFADAGGLMSYGPDLIAFRRFAATYVSRILKGARPADLPIQQPSNFLFVVNQKAAAALGLALPQSLLVGADEAIA